MSNDTPRIRVGIGGWNFAEWRGGVFYPAGLPAAQELHFASRQVTSIEINATTTARPETARHVSTVRLATTKASQETAR